MEPIQIKGTNILTEDEKKLANKLLNEYYPKIQRQIKNIISLQVHIKEYEKNGKRKKYSINVKIINVLIDNKQPVIKRVFSFLQYMIFSIWYALTLPIDVVIASSGPISVGVPGLIAKFFRGCKLVFEVRDLWPGGAIEMGIVRNKMMIWLLKKFVGKHYR